MRTLAALLLSVVLTSSAQADACWFEAPSGDRLTFLDNGENEVVRQYADGQTETCVYGHTDDGASTIWCDYESETQSTLSQVADGIEAFEETWRSHCDDKGVSL
jgi:hypothetical protein